MCGLMLNMWVEMRIIVIFGNLFGLFGFLMELIKVRFSENYYMVEGFMLFNEDDEMEVKLENVFVIMDGSDVDM